MVVEEGGQQGVLLDTFLDNRPTNPRKHLPIRYGCGWCKYKNGPIWTKRWCRSNSHNYIDLRPGPLLGHHHIVHWERCEETEEIIAQHLAQLYYYSTFHSVLKYGWTFLLSLPSLLCSALVVAPPAADTIAIASCWVAVLLWVSLALLWYEERGLLCEWINGVWLTEWGWGWWGRRLEGGGRLQKSCT